MFESAELRHTLDKTTFKRRLPALRTALLKAQTDLIAGKRFGVVLIIHGAPGAGRSEFANALSEWIDPRHVETHAFGALTDEERARPPNWRCWRELPARGRIGVFLSSWYSDALEERIAGEIGGAAFERRLEQIKHLERMLVADGHLVIKLWFHLAEKDQRRRLKKLAASKLTRWQVSDVDWRHARAFHRFRALGERVLRETSTTEAPWRLIDGWDRHWRELEAGRFLLETLRGHLDAPPPPRPPPPARHGSPPERPNVLSALDLSRRLAPERYEQELARWQAKLARLVRKRAFLRRRSAVLVFEGNDAAGKGGAIRRITQAIDQRQLRVVPIAAPTEEERARPYLWRFWRHVPGHGEVTIFDRSWYGRVLVERVEGFAREADWRRAYEEINEFEEELVAFGIVVVKFFLVVSPQEQLKRFRAREKTKFKRFKITAEDWRNRAKRPAYDEAICDMVERTSSEVAPWTLVEAEDKLYARIKVLKTLCGALES
jgi:polyphosphate:AMP phosphotransferase